MGAGEVEWTQLGWKAGLMMRSKRTEACIDAFLPEAGGDDKLPRGADFGVDLELELFGALEGEEGFGEDRDRESRCTICLSLYFMAATRSLAIVQMKMQPSPETEMRCEPDEVNRTPVMSSE